ncbi:MAG: lipid II flippase Amj family protein [Thermotaleaceae bacterium]
MVFGDGLLWKLTLLTVVIHLVDTLSYSVRLNSVKSGQFALSLSLFNLIVLVSRTANTFQGPLIGRMIDTSIKVQYDPLWEIRTVIVGATVGTTLGILMMPTFLKVFSKAVRKLEVSGSIPAIVVQALSLGNIRRIANNTVRPSRGMIHGLRFKNIPKRLLLLNAFITGIYAIGVLAAYYAAVYVPENRLAAAGSSGMINGIASILLTMFVDPRAAIITDEAYRGKRQYGDVKSLVIILVGTKFLGTLLGQVFLIPAAKIIAYFYM